MLLFFMEKIATATFAKLNQCAKKSRNLAEAGERSSIFHLSFFSVFISL